MRIIKKSAIWIITLIYLIVVFGFVDNRFENQLCNRIKISVRDSVNTRFLNDADIRRVIDHKGIKYLGLPLHSIDLVSIEEAVRKNQLVKECKAFTGVKGTLQVEILQRQPLVRVIEASGRGYYIDRDGNVLNLSSRYTPHILVVNGRFNTMLKIGEPANVLKIADSRSNRLLKDIYELAIFIENNKLWQAQIVQVYVNKSGEFELIPRVGPHVIILGSLIDYEKKFEKLEIFYKEGLNRVGWNNYVKINLKYKDQIVCSKI
jgi:cell division protein FtsQ